MGEFTFALVALQIAVVGIFYRLFVTVKVWGYIAVPLGAPHITMWTAFGLQVLFMLLRPVHYHQDNSMKTVMQDSLSKLIEISIVWALTYWLFG